MSKKNKRGDRGSVEEETSQAKKSNMAESDEENRSLPENEPSRLEIKHILINIEATMTDIKQENRNLKKELEGLKESMSFNEKEFQEIKASLKKAAEKNASLSEELTKTKEELQATTHDLEQEKEETSKVWCALDVLEQYTRKNSLEIHGLPEHVYSDTESAVIKVANALQVNLRPEDIEISHKLKGREGKRPIIVKFCSHKTKTKLYRKRTKLRSVKVADIFPSYAAAVTESNEDRIYINENLTPYRRDVLKEANQRKKNKQLASVWTLDGKIYTKTSPDGQRFCIFSTEDLNNI